MIANPTFLNQGNEFWATVKFLSQELGYSKNDVVIVPTIGLIKSVFQELSYDINKIEDDGQLTEFGAVLLHYFHYRAAVLNEFVCDNLMDVDEAKALYKSLKVDYTPKCPLPKNKQKGDKAGDAYYTGIINILIEKSIGNVAVNYDPRQITAFTLNNFPAKTLSRRLDGSFPNEINPIAVWEIKEYYYTTTFGSRIADGVYESMLDGYELIDAREIIQRDVFHYLMIDSKHTWWKMGKSYLCRIIDMLHMGLITECVFGKEAITRIPEIVNQWQELYEIHKEQYPEPPQATLEL